MKFRALPTRGATPAARGVANAPFVPRRAIGVVSSPSTPTIKRSTTSSSSVHSLRPLQATSRPSLVIVRASEASEASETSPSGKKTLSILWLKHDLRVDDNAGLISCSSSSSSPSSSSSSSNHRLLPLYVLDGAAIRETSPGPCGARALVAALQSLRESLRARGSDLVVVACDPSSPGGDSADAVVARAARELGASRVVAESEFSPAWRARLKRVEERLAAEAEKGDEGEGEAASCEVVEWSAGLHVGGDDDGGEKLKSASSGDWREHLRSRGARLAPLDAPESLPPLPSGYERAFQGLLRAEIPTVDEVLSLVSVSASASSDDESSPSSSPISLESVGSVLPYGAPDSAKEVAASLVYSGGEATARAALSAYVFGESEEEADGSGGLAAAVAAASADADVPGSEGASFAALFAPSLALGTISPRRVAAEASAALAGLPPLPFTFAPFSEAAARRTRSRAALAAAEAADFHRSVALSRAGAAARGGGELRHWRWRGVLTEYVVVKPGDVAGDDGRSASPPPPSKGNVLLVHGFGAFGEHYRDAASALAKKGFTVYAPTLPGYGRSEKPPARYGQGLWGSFVEEFAREVVRGPVVAAGNSIGGYIVSAAAASSGRGLFRGVVLLNPAGRVDGIATGQETGGGAPVQLDGGEEGESSSSSSSSSSSPPSSSKPPSRLFVEVVSRALFLYLELSVGRTLKKLYPSNPDAADAWLAAEIGRAARDPGALAVFQSVFYMPRPRALDVLLVKEYRGPTLLLQGARDPLNDARGRAEALRGAVPGIEVILLDAGHCPQDEVPSEVAERISAFAERCFGSGETSSSSSSSSEAAVVAA